MCSEVVIQTSVIGVTGQILSNYVMCIVRHVFRVTCVCVYLKPVEKISN